MQVPFQLKGASNSLILGCTIFVVVIYATRSGYDFLSAFDIIMTHFDPVGVLSSLLFFPLLPYSLHTIPLMRQNFVGSDWVVQLDSVRVDHRPLPRGWGRH